MMSSLTIVIPTRERCDTLPFTIKTCVSQDYHKLTILIVDNFSHDNTSDVVSGFSDKRIRYVNSGRRLGMSANWELALREVDSDYVMFLGDDDGILPGAVSELMGIVAGHGSVDAITWPSVDYGWPSCPNGMLKNSLVIPLKRGLQQRQSSRILSDVISFKRPYSELPFLYKGMVGMGAVERLRSSSGGNVFHSMIPDVYFGIASCAIIENYFHSFRSFTVNGASSHSNGTAIFSGAKSDENGAQHLFLSEDNIPFYSALNYCPSIPVLITESLIQAKSRLSALEQFQVDIDGTVLAAVEQARRAEPDTFQRVISALRTLPQETALRPATRRALEQATNQPFFPTERVYGEDIFSRRYIVNCEEFHVTDVFSASIIAECFLKLHADNQLSTVTSFKNVVRLVARELIKRRGRFQC
ncbi:MAG: glycosyltransferase family 2 protein [Candidatus Accumulibacter sp. UW26]|jgi:glycosyltransferase involved in cell wall biosynthesis